ncbi:GntR family transcriptional regulator [Manganibacter manganicus]|uniref:HTH gntR-type domain-containing protein n=1 Tax=Manganibacter manganicus TaxID=1873176 RepID=A0A1V8RLU2_9HYPH|nr:GntR family transcriptional regulator [Pseudaminobacter manganicus]OQM74160.1 hypothetical protein BFN67_22440 [Pseudaminobacter manganicus]
MTDNAVVKRLVVRSRNLVSQLNDELRIRIQSGRFKAGDRLNINALSKEFGISATPIREALAMLSAERLVVFRENVGYRVAPPPTKEEFIQWATARVLIETQSLLLNKEPISPETISRLKDANARIASDEGSGVTQMTEFQDANWEFHKILVGLARNEFLSAAHETLYHGRRFSQIFLGRGVVDRSRIVSEHQGIIDALETGTLETASNRLREHVLVSVARDRKFASDAGKEDCDVE